MAGIYIHVPFCLSKCAYCDFYSIDGSVDEDRFVNRISSEIAQRKGFLRTNSVSTIYFGGGTPSLLSPKGIGTIVNAIYGELDVCPNPEITLEANPDDLTKDYLIDIQQSAVNRLSIGIQSFCDTDLKLLGRRHTAKQGHDAVLTSTEAGIENIGIDLIYGLPTASTEHWRRNIEVALMLPIKHLSCYHLTIEEGTPLYREFTKGDFIPIGEEQSVEEYNILRAMATKEGFEQYEVSNFARVGYHSKHNSSYWQQVPYLGLGPSAHSYNGTTREWNPKSMSQWAKAIDEQQVCAEQEILTETDRLNEYLLASLRTVWGVDLSYIEKEFGPERAARVRRIASRYIANGKMVLDGMQLSIPTHSFFVSDGIIADFMEC